MHHIVIVATPEPNSAVCTAPSWSLCTPMTVQEHEENSVMKFADDATVNGRITENNETSNREEIRKRAEELRWSK